MFIVTEYAALSKVLHTFENNMEKRAIFIGYICYIRYFKDVKRHYYGVKG